MNSWQLSSEHSKELQELLAANFVPSPCKSWEGWKVGWLGLVTSDQSRLELYRTKPMTRFEVLEDDDKKGKSKDTWFTLSSMLMHFESVQT